MALCCVHAAQPELDAFGGDGRAQGAELKQARFRCL